jgi:hypothetical protein
MVAVHGELEEAKLRLGIRTRMDNMPKTHLLSENETERAVAEAI